MKRIYRFKLALIILAVLSLTVTNLQAKDIEKVKIDTESVQCGMCEETIETAVMKLDGVIKVSVNHKKKYAKVKYDSEIVSLDEIRNAISKAGYDADDVKADKEAYDKLHHCCKLPKDR